MWGKARKDSCLDGEKMGEKMLKKERKLEREGEEWMNNNKTEEKEGKGRKARGNLSTWG